MMWNVLLNRTKKKLTKIYMSLSQTAQLYGHSKQGGCGVCQRTSMGS